MGKGAYGACERCGAPGISDSYPPRVTACRCGGRYVWSDKIYDPSTTDSHDVAVAKSRGSVLLEAHKTINGARRDVYGSPEDSFALIAEYWNTYTASKVTECAVVTLNAKDVAMMMTLFKIAREANQHARDSVRDAAGYLGIYADMQDESK